MAESTAANTAESTAESTAETTTARNTPSALQARRVLRNAILRSSRRHLTVVAAFAVIAVLIFANGRLTLGIETYDGVHTQDGTLRWSLGFIAFGLALALAGRRSTTFTRLVQRLPVDPVAVLQAQLQVGLSLGVIVFCMFMLSELLARPAMMHPSFSGRLNPAEEATLSRLPGVPLLRFTIDGVVTRGLVSELSLAAMRTPDGDGNVTNYGSKSRWPHFVDTPLLQPGATVATLEPRDWASLDRFPALQLRLLGIPSPADVEITLERYVPRDEYLAQPWRRDGLHRERSWHGLDRAVGFFGLLTFMICALRTDHNSLLLGLVAPASLSLLFFSDYGRLIGRRQLMFSDLDHVKQPSLPTLEAQQTIGQNLLWPIFMISVCIVVYVFIAQQMRRSGGEPFGQGRPFAQQIRPRWRSGLRHRLELLALPAVLLAYVKWMLGLAGYNMALASSLVWSFALVGTAPLALVMVFRWERRDALLSRLPVDPATVASQRLIATVLGFAVLSQVPHVFDLLTGSTTRWALILLIMAIGCALMLLILLLRGLTLGGQLGVMVLFFGFMTGMMALWTLTPTIRFLACLLIAVIQLPILYHLMRTNVALGRAPTFGELAGSRP